MPLRVRTGILIGPTNFRAPPPPPGLRIEKKTLKLFSIILNSASNQKVDLIPIFILKLFLHNSSVSNKEGESRGCCIAVLELDSYPDQNVNKGLDDAPCVSI